MVALWRDNLAFNNVRPGRADLQHCAYMQGYAAWSQK